MLTFDRAHQLLTYDPNTGELRWKVTPARSVSVKAGDLAGTVLDGYRRVKVDGTHYRVHRLIWLMAYGSWPAIDLDHLNGDRQDNRLENLREATATDNARNRAISQRSRTGVYGVTLLGSRWRVGISTNDGYASLGCFNDFFEAVCARKSAELQHGYSHTHGRIAA